MACVCLPCAYIDLTRDWAHFELADRFVFGNCACLPAATASSSFTTLSSIREEQCTFPGYLFLNLPILQWRQCSVRCCTHEDIKQIPGTTLFSRTVNTYRIVLPMVKGPFCNSVEYVWLNKNLSLEDCLWRYCSCKQLVVRNDIFPV